jgi:hypothetical protein
VDCCYSNLLDLLRVKTHVCSYNEWMSFNSHLEKSVWSTRIGRITPIWNPLPNCRVRSYEVLSCSRVIGTWSPRSSACRSGVVSRVNIPTLRTHTSNSVQNCAPGPTTTLQ